MSATLLLSGAVAARLPHAHALIDTTDLPRVSARRWHLHDNGHGGYYVRDAAGTYLHRLVLENPAGQVDHRDGNTLNCTRRNLRLATAAQNSQNRRPARGRAMKGIYFTGRRWRARIAAGGKRHSLGTYRTRREAQAAYRKAARLHHGEFARLNEVTNG